MVKLARSKTLGRAMLSTALSYRLIAQNMERTTATTASQPLVERDTGYYLENIGNVRTIDEFIKDDRLYRYAMKAFGLDDMAYAKAFMRKVLTEGVTSNDSFANKLTDKRYHEFALIFDFHTYGEAATSFPSAQEGVVNRYIRQTVEEQAGEQNEGVRLALYFERKAPEITSTYGLLADPALTQVVQTLLGLPAATSGLDIDKQAEIIERSLNIEDLKDPETLRTLLTRFVNMWDVQNQTFYSAPVAILSSPAMPGFSPDLLMALQTLRLGGI